MTGRIVHRVIVILVGLYAVLFSSLGAATMASPSILKSYSDLFANLEMSVVLPIVMTIVFTEWWRIAAVPVLLAGLWGNWQGWGNERSRFSVFDIQLLEYGAPLVILAIAVSVVVVDRFAKRTGDGDRIKEETA